jgi:hypothetical protein
VDYDNDYEWCQWNMTGKIRILMDESNAAPPMAHYFIKTGDATSAATPVSSLMSKKTYSTQSSDDVTKIAPPTSL